MSRGTQTNAAILPTVSRPTKKIITLGGYPSPASSHPPRPLPPHGTAGSLLEVTGQIGKAHHVLHYLSNLLIPLVPWGAEVDIQIAEEERNMPTRAFVPGLLDRCCCAQVVWWDVASHNKNLAASCYQHEGQYVRPPNPPVLDQVGCGCGRGHVHVRGHGRRCSVGLGVEWQRWIFWILGGHLRSIELGGPLRSN
jgi:hypothetical protein